MGTYSSSSFGVCGAHVCSYLLGAQDKELEVREHLFQSGLDDSPGDLYHHLLYPTMLCLGPSNDLHRFEEEGPSQTSQSQVQCRTDPERRKEDV